MPLIEWGAWTPDVADYEGPGAKNIQNVIPRGDGYGPWPDFTYFTQALPGVCRGAFYALKSDGSVNLFAATSTKLYQLNNTTFAWTDVSLSGGSYSALSSNANWQFAQTGNFVFATQANAVLQIFDMSSATTFVNATGSPPQAAYIGVVGRFLVLSGLLSFPYRIQWSGLNNFNASTSWDNTTLQSNYQDLPDGGVVRGVAGGEFGVIFQDQVIRSMSYIVGSAVIFQIEKIADQMGLAAPYSVVKGGSTVYFYSNKGFQKIEPGGVPVQIGRERVDRTFLSNLDIGSLQLFMGASDPRASRVYWAYKSTSGQTGLYDTILGYDSVLDKWFQIAMTGEYLTPISQSGITLEALDAIAPTPLAITAMANNGSGNTRLTLTETNANYTIIGQNTIVVYGATGTTGANGTWYFQSGTGNPSAGNFTIIDGTHVDLGVAYVATGTASVGGSLDAMILSLDAYPTAVQPQISQFDSSNRLGFFTGSNLQAILQSSEQGTAGDMIYLDGFRPITDAPDGNILGSLSWRETQGQSVTVGSEIAANSRTGYVNTRREARYQRMQIRIPYGTTWSFSAGVEPAPELGGKN